MTNYEIKVKISEESDLYSPFDPDGLALNGDFLDYITDQYEQKNFGEAVTLTFHGAEIDEVRLKRALDAHVDGEIIKVSKQIQLNRMKQPRLFLIGLLFVAAGILLATYWSAVPVEILSIVGSFAVWEAANIWIVGNPTLKLRKRFLNELKNAEIHVEKTK